MLAVCVSVMCLLPLLSCAIKKADMINENGLVISEVVSSNSASYHVARIGSPDWIELYNAGESAIDLSGYRIYKSEDDSFTFSDFVIEPGEYKLLCACASVYESDAYCIGFRLSKAGESLVIEDPEENEVAVLTFGELASDISYAYFNGEYCYSTTPTPGSENIGVFFDKLADAQNNAVTEGLVLSEAADGWAELYNGSEFALNLSMYYLSDSPADTEKAQLPQVMLAPGEYFTVGLNNAEGYDAKVSFGVAADESLYLFSRDEILSSLETAGLFSAMSIGLDGNGRPVYYLETTPGKANSEKFFTIPKPSLMGAKAGLHINELMLKNTVSLIDEDGDRSDWVELWNNSNETIRLSDFYLSDEEADLLKWQLPEAEIGAGEYVIVYLDSKDREYHTSFNLGENETLYLTDMANFCYEELYFPDEGRLDNISYGLKEGSWLYFGKSTPGKENTSHGSEDLSNVEKLDKTGIFITEVSATATARSGKKDWIELYNGGNKSVSLDDLYLSNDKDNLKLFQLSGTISPGSYKLIYASSKPTLQKDGVANFGISTAGEELYLTDENGAILDHFETGYLRVGTTSGRAKNDYSGSRVFFENATPGEANGRTIGSYLNAPEFSLEGGFYEGSITLELFGEGEIYYTTDGSEPDRNAKHYTGPITLSENTAISAVCYEEGRLMSDPAVSTYLFSDPHELPVVCLTMDPEDFRKVYAVSDKKGPIVEKKCNIEYYTEDGVIGTSFVAGARVAGNSTRTYAQKSLNLYLRSGYGQSSVVYPFFEGYPITEFKGLTLRNSGQDNDDERIADLYASVLMRGLDLDYAEGRFAVLYVNGRYYGLYDLKENQNEDWLASRYNIDPDKTNVIRRNRTVLNGSNTQIKQVYAIAQSRNMSSEENYEYFCQFVDPEAFIDYIIAQSFCGNGDMFNQKLWHMNDYSVRVRPVFFDLDFAFGGSNASVLSAFFTGDGVASPDGSLTNMYIPTALKKNAGWREKFITRCAYLINNHFDKSLEIFDELVAQMETEMKRHISRWHTPSSYSAWQGKIRNMRTVISNRPKALARQMQNVFDVSSARMAELFPQWY